MKVWILLPERMMTRRALRLGMFFVAGCLSRLCVPEALAQRPVLQNNEAQAKASDGKRVFTSICAGCHGLDGRGGVRAPGIAGSARIRRLSDKELADLISNGISGTGMPAFHSLSGADVRAVASYIRTLLGEVELRTLPGDPKRGEVIFFGKAECATCHAISGRGGFIGPDLSNYGPKTSADAICEAILSAYRTAPQGYKLATAITADGQRIEGIVRNEDNFSVQLLSLDGNFHFFDRNDLQKLEFSTSSLMPTDYQKRLSRNELDDLVSYLISPGSAVANKPTSETKEGKSE
jgi:cytochrome c oxidase cbb3-type subunit III